MLFRFALAVTACLLLAAPLTQAQTFPTDDPVLEAIWDEGVERSQVERLAQVLLDSIGPRLVGTPQQQVAHEWAVDQYARWGISARNEQYGTWRGWERGTSHVDLIAPRVRSLDAMMLAWSPATDGPVEGRVITLPEVDSGQSFDEWLGEVAGAFVLVSFPQPTCRPDGNWEEHARPETVERMREERSAAREAWDDRIREMAASVNALAGRLEAAGAAGMITSNWSGGWGAERIFGTVTQSMPAVSVSCEDYGLLHRLAANDQGPRLRVDLQSRFLGEVPTFNTIAEIRGTELPDEYVILSAHFDSWDGSSGATDNGTGTVMMMEVMRILQEVYPSPRRTILAGHWGGEEQGLNGSRAFTEDHPDIVEGVQAVLNQDNGTGRIANISMSGFTGAGSRFASWLSQVPHELTREIRLDMPGSPGRGGSDHASFICHGAPAFFLAATSWDYFTYTWHTNRDTYDKIVFDDLRHNALLGAMLAYLAAEDDERMPRDQVSAFPPNPFTGAEGAWPECRPAQRSFDRAN